MNKYDVEDFLRTLFETIVGAASRGSGIVVKFKPDQCQSIRDAIKHDAYLTVNLEGVFEDDNNNN